MLKFICLFITLILFVPQLTYSGPGVTLQNSLDFMSTDELSADSEEVYAIYDLRDRSSYIQITRVDDREEEICIHVQIFQQDKGCVELDFEDR